MSLAKDDAEAPPVQTAGLWDYIAIARLDHCTKHIFVVPGIILAYMLRGVRTEHFVWSLVLGAIALVCVASANYAINEYSDRAFDKHHPDKSRRPAVQRRMSGRIVALEWAGLIAAGLICAGLACPLLFWAAALFALQGIVYNVSPLRTKDKAYFDVISESINNPIRLTIGWAMVDPTSLPPASLILPYWFGGAFLMAAKRLSEYREIVAACGAERLARYRASFAHYSEVSLTASCICYSLCAVTFLAVFLVKYRIEYLLLMPVAIALLTWYFVMATHPGSTAQKPEKLFREPLLMALVVLFAAIFLVASFVDMPLLESLSGQRFISLK